MLGAYTMRHPRRDAAIRSAVGALLVPMLLGGTASSAAFVDRTAQLQLAPNFPVESSAAWGDFNNDGYADLCAYGALWRNNGGTDFTSLGGDFGCSVFGDYDNDGYLDIFKCRGPALVKRNLLGTGFADVSVPALPTEDNRGACWADLDGNAYLDVYVTGYEAGGYQPDAILSNDRGTSFVLSWTEPLVPPDNVHFPGRGVTACDFDEDGDQDVYVSNYRLEANYLWRNDGNGQFTDVAAAYGVAGVNNEWRWSYGHTIGAAWGDMNNDGHLDLFVGNFAHPEGSQDRARLYENDGPPAHHFTERWVLDGADYQESYSAPALGDYDNDGDLDLYFTTIYPGEYPRLYRNNGNRSFTDVTAAEGLSKIPPTYQAAWADFDNDGDLDLVTGGRLYVNQGNANHWLRVDLEGDGVSVNRCAIGAQVRIALGDGTILTRQVEGGTGEGSQNELTLHFGLGSRTGPVDLEVLWPDGSTRQVRGVPVDQRVRVSMGRPRP